MKKLSKETIAVKINSIHEYTEALNYFKSLGCKEDPDWEAFMLESQRDDLDLFLIITDRVSVALHAHTSDAPDRNIFPNLKEFKKSRSIWSRLKFKLCFKFPLT